jgi:16S rRNA (cytidine1402-2'-O)-methyltransferase
MSLIICGTPIGNLGDAAPRLTEALRSCDVVFAEDTRRTRILLDHLGVDVPLRSFFSGNEDERADEMGRHLADGEVVGLVTDAGMPSISDPGLSAVRVARSAGADVTVIPGPSAVTAALAVSGLPTDRFTFEGFLPRRRGRGERIAEIATEPRTVVFFASPRRVGDDLRDLAAAIDDDRQVFVARELTKLHEELWWGSLDEAARHYESEQRGEFTIVLAGAPERSPDLEDAVDAVRALITEGETMSRAVRTVAERSGVPRRALYEMMLRSE